MVPDEPGSGSELTDSEVEAMHEVELGIEWLHRAHGKLLGFHHNTGHAMEHLAEAETLLRESGHHAIADDVRDRYLPRGVIDDDRWTYDVVECFEEGLLNDLTAFEERARREVTDGRRHVAERRQEREWKRRARTERESAATPEEDPEPDDPEAHDDEPGDERAAGLGRDAEQ